MPIDPLGLGAIVQAIHALHASLDVVARIHELLWSAIDAGRATERFLSLTTNRGGTAAFVTDPTIQHVLPYTRRVANAGLTLAAIYASARLMWSHGMFTHYTLRTMLPRLLLAVFLVNFSSQLFQAAVDMNNALCVEALNATMGGIDLGRVIRTWADESWMATGLGPATAVALVAGYLALSFAYVIRYAVLVVLVVLSPLAALMMLLDETKTYAHEWLSLTVTTLLMQPLQLFILGIGVNFETNSGSAFPLRHGFALAALWIAYKVPGALRAASLAGGQASAAGKHLLHGATHHGRQAHAAARVPSAGRVVRAIL